MNWKKSLFVVVPVSLAVLAMAGCSQAEKNVPAAEPTQTAPGATDSLPPVNGGSIPLKPTDNGTMPLPPEGGQPGQRPTPSAMDLATAAAKLGVTEQRLQEAMGDTLQGPPDLAAAAQKLGISEQSLREALGFSENMTSPGGPPIGGTPPAGQGPTGQGQ